MYTYMHAPSLLTVRMLCVGTGIAVGAGVIVAVGTLPFRCHFILA